MTVTPAKIRSVRAYLGDTQEQFASRFKVTRYVVIHWEKYGIVNQSDLERRIRNLEGPDHDPHDTGVAISDPPPE